MRNWQRSTVTGLAIGLMAMAFGLAPDPASAQSDAERIRAGYLLIPVPVRRLARQSQRDQVALGSYLVNAVGGCNDCHTNPPFAPGGDPYLGQPKVINAEGYLAGGVEFGPFTSRNLTPDEHGMPAGLTFAQFQEVLNDGTDFKHLHPQISDLLQVMPWPVYGGLTKKDKRAIYTYLSVIPSIPSH